MKSSCLKYRKDTEDINPKVLGTSNGKAMILSKCAICGSKKSRFIKNQEAKRLLRSLGLRTPLSKVTILGDISGLNAISLNAIPTEYKMNEIVNNYNLINSCRKCI